MNDASKQDATPDVSEVEIVEAPARSSDELGEPGEPSVFSAVWDFVMHTYCWFAIAMILYVLSAGPLFSYYQTAVETGTNPVLQLLYLPLAAMCSQSETFDTVVQWYVSFWA